MAKMNLLEITQDILSDMDSDEVNSINDTVEALQVAQIIRATYYTIIDGKENPWMKRLFTITGSGDTNKPTHMEIPSDVLDVMWIKYNVRLAADTRDKYTDIKYLTQQKFLTLTEVRDSSASTVDNISDYNDGTPLLISNNKAPQYFTSFDDKYVVFDSYDVAVETSLQTSKIQAYGKKYPTFTFADSFTPDLPIQMFSYLLNEAKSVCFSTLKQAVNQKAEQHSITQRRRMSQEAWKIGKGITYPHYGRK